MVQQCPKCADDESDVMSNGELHELKNGKTLGKEYIQGIKIWGTPIPDSLREKNHYRTFLC